MRRPSAATVIALLALFVALGGPAEAARLINGKTIRPNTITSKQVKAGSLSTTDLSRASRASLRATPAGSITARELRDGSVTRADLAPGAVDAAAIVDGSVGSFDLAAGSVFADELAPGAVGGDALVTEGVGARALADGSVRAGELADGQVGRAEIPDGVLGASDVGRFAGTFSDLDFGVVDVATCKSVTSASLTPVSASQDLSDDAIVVTPERTFPSAGLTVTAKPASADQIEVTICNVAGPAGLAVGPRSFRFVTFDAAE